ncbi:hypothetical protein [Sulfurihydrogenibium subterraneum]|uniref:hypothetical protein n=1 Tax=Sulfurihydrogenibium subterraneum TaxID=171121 RepID=UPI0004900EEF|nr:hypothetical protein [Sulfurihydrogenibium subterraneum]
MNQVDQVYDDIHDEYCVAVYGENISGVETDIEVEFKVNIGEYKIDNNPFKFTISKQSIPKYIFPNKIFKPPIV